MSTFALAVFFLLISPGPGVLTTAGVGSGFGYRPGLRFVAGLFIGTNLVAFAVISGLAAVALSVPEVRVALVWASAAFFVWLAARIALSGARIGFIESASAPGFIGGLLLQFINPKAYAVNNLLFSGYAFWPESLAVEVVIKLLILNAIWIPVHLAWLGAGVALKRLDLSPGAQRAINLAMAFSLLAVVALAALSER
ncbi:LysE family transporter [Pikeienuella piscinae]|uniref:LysE family transporter n=1 Tax=Pikeienuella piscinae TaxID=2748098 RepID=A0A7L5BT97_9RHOB|nr:LysE family transporter [Pikeienuella piscinae]QIE54765.1 LysE family transporter [Pikeienuella piscinae]